MYVRPTRNRLPGLRGMRGLGDCAPGTGTDMVACVPSIGTSATVEVTPSGATVTGQGASSGYQQTFGPSAVSPTDWLNANASVLLWIGGIALGVMFLSKVAR